MKLMTTVEEQRQILESCHSDSTFEHFGTTKREKSCRVILLVMNV